MECQNILKKFKFFILFLLFVHFVNSCQCEQSDILIRTDTGFVRGFKTEKGRYFYGIPYAEPPIGKLRFSYPRPKLPWSGELNATKAKFSCIQPAPKTEPISEDCLFLNILTPTGSIMNSPVLVFIHGGGLIHGSGDLYDGEHIAQEEDVIVVTINYRLGALGFGFFEEFAQQSSATGNYGLLDQQLAFTWIKANIKNFGGNPDSITLFGESAGGTGILFHLVDPKTAGLFHRAIIMSAPFDTKTPAAARRTGQVMKQELGCIDNSNPNNTIACLMSKNTSEFLRVQGQQLPFSFAPVLSSSIHSLLEIGRFHKIPILIGTNFDEIAYFLCPQYENGTLLEYYAATAAYYGFKKANELVNFYSIDKFENKPMRAMVALATDDFFRCPMTKALTFMAKWTSNDTFLYSYNYKDSGFSTRCMRASHAYELPYLFPGVLNFFGRREYRFSEEELDLAKRMKRMWADFARGRVENQFLPFDPVKLNFKAINHTDTYEKGFRKQECDFWQRLSQ